MDAVDGLAPAEPKPDSESAPAPAESEPDSESAPERGEAARAAANDAEAAADSVAQEKKGDAAAARDIAVAQPRSAGDVAGDEMPPDRPNKPVLAAVAIGGAVVLAVPILLIGTGSHHEKKHPTAAAADTLLPGLGQQPPGAFVPSTPTPTSSPTPSASTKKKDKAKAEKKASPSASVRALGKAVSNERPSPSAPSSVVIHAPRDIFPGKTVRTNRIALTMQTGGNLVLRDRSNKIIWSTRTHKRGVYAEFQTDGNLVLYAAGRKPVWAAGSFGHDNSTLVLQSDYNMVIVDHDGHPVWATGTNR
jgi:hypothetical protein